jgi:hypothetical protein
MVYKTQDYWVLDVVNRPVTEVCSFCRVQQSGCLPPAYLRKETDPVSETLCSLEYRMMVEVQKPNKAKRKVKLSLRLIS